MENLCCLVLVLGFALVHRPADAGPFADVNRVLATYNLGFDICREIDERSGPEARAAANQECDRAFRTLDDLELNNCSGWRFAECRVVPGDRYRNHQCTCLISFCDRKSVKSGIITSFRSCVKPILKTHEARAGVDIAPSSGFQEARINFQESLKEANLRRVYGEGYGESSSGVRSSGGASTSRPKLPINRAGSTNLTPASEYGFPGAPYATYAPGPSNKRARTGSYVCGECQKPHFTEKSMKRHEETHRAPDRSCIACDQPFATRLNYLRHMQNKHPEEEIPDAEAGSGQDAEANLYKCEDCNKSYKNLASLQDHKKYHDGLTKCDKCNTIFPRGSALASHKKRGCQN